MNSNIFYGEANESASLASSKFKIGNTIDNNTRPPIPLSERKPRSRSRTNRFNTKSYYNHQQESVYGSNNRNRHDDQRMVESRKVEDEYFRNNVNNQNYSRENLQTSSNFSVNKRNNSQKQYSHQFSDSKVKKDPIRLVESDIRETKEPSINDSKMDNRRASTIPTNFKSAEEELEYLRKKYKEKKNIIGKLISKVDQYREVNLIRKKKIGK